MSGPCLCGDPYCPWCGDPSAGAYEAFIDSLAEELKGLTESECRLFVLAGKSALANANEAHFFPPERVESEDTRSRRISTARLRKTKT